jgi:hypothetical protein
LKEDDRGTDASRTAGLQAGPIFLASGTLGRRGETLTVPLGSWSGRLFIGRRLVTGIRMTQSGMAGDAAHFYRLHVAIAGPKFGKFVNYCVGG